MRLFFALAKPQSTQRKIKREDIFNFAVQLCDLCAFAVQYFYIKIILFYLIIKNIKIFLQNLIILIIP